MHEDRQRTKPEDQELFEQMFLATERFLPVAALDQNEGLQRSIEENRFPLIAYPRSLFLGEALEHALSERANKSMATSVVAESGLGPAVLEFVRQGIGIGWLPQSPISKELEDKSFTVLIDVLPMFDLDVVLIRSKSNASKRNSKTWQWIETDISENADILV